ncbi:CoA transferase [Nocardia sp. NBC_00565]|uniref:CaiB/BaiF CoA transferase family protein n=1 Tax=Nocardia sp. NBC_00565 TaxID=2975993 RepID=UPI002E8166F7|nr:CoA transferase [Nocardia sp. NBC_00565]WUC06615.1 CoA transferase [Nocardia sp. NBC_00565]
MSSAEVDGGFGPLEGVRVLDLSRVIMGPLATQILGDQGAEVIMLEAASGDTNRVMGSGPHPELSGIALNLLRNKRSVVVDFKTAEGMEVVHRLVSTCDVVVTTMRPHVLKRLGLDYESLRQYREDIVYCQAQGFSIASPQANEPAYDDIIQAATGVCDIMSRVFGVPALMPTIFADKACGLIMAQAVTAALFRRERSGEGQHIEVPMVQAMKAFMLAEHGGGATSAVHTEANQERVAGYGRVLSKERRAHPTKDGLVHMLPYLPKHYVALFTAVGRPDAATDPRYVDTRATIVNAESLYRDVRQACATRTTQEWLDFCKAEGVPVTKVVTLEEMVAELPVVSHPVVGEFHLTSQMANFSSTPGGVRRLAPMIGEHTAEVLAALQGDPWLSASVSNGASK